jgi:hypothetical protein
VKGTKTASPLEIVTIRTRRAGSLETASIETRSASPPGTAATGTAGPLETAAIENETRIVIAVSLAVAAGGNRKMTGNDNVMAAQGQKATKS